MHRLRPACRNALLICAVAVGAEVTPSRAELTAPPLSVLQPIAPLALQLPAVAFPPISPQLDPLLGEGASGRVANHPVDLAAVRSFYLARGGKLAWVDADRHPSARAAALLAVLQAAGAEGLDPAFYQAQVIADLMQNPGSGVELDLLLSDALIAYVTDLSGGRIAPGASDERDLTYARPLDGAATAATLVEAAPDELPARLAALAPTTPDYLAARSALAAARASAGWPVLGEGAVLHPGESGAEVAALRARLAADEPTLAKAKQPESYDAPLKAAAMRFQAAHGLKADGTIGLNTRIALNVTPQQRVDQLVANMERMRWFAHADLGAHHVQVNIPAYRLEYVEDGHTLLEMPVVVGTAERKTPVLASRIAQVVVNPTWTVPETIATKDILPRLRRDPGYLAERGLTLTSAGAAIDPERVDWDHARITSYRLRQAAGARNPLGRFKFFFENAWGVYLHDSPEKQKFVRDQRNFSSGCVRVGDAEALALMLLKDQPLGDKDRLEQLVNAGATRFVALPEPVPVHIVYRTVWLDPDGTLVLANDPYGRDPRLAQALAKPRRAEKVRLATN